MNDNQMNTQYSGEEFNVGISGKSQKMLYFVVAIAALIVALISGTFAYFTAQASDTTTVKGTIASTSLSMAVTPIPYTKTAANGTNLIPMDTTSMANLNTALTNSCIDKNGYTACQVYRIAITVPANSPRIAITGKVNVAANTGSAIPNLTYTVLGAQTTGTTQAVMTDLTTSAAYYNAKKTLGNDLVFSSIDTTTSPQNGYLAATTTATATYNYYLIVWLEDTGTVQNTIDYGSFVGTVSVNSASGNITATFSS